MREHLDVLTNWYVRTQRERFWDEDADAFDTLWTALEALTRVMAPLAPLVAEEIWRGLTGGRSVHLTDWPARRSTRRPRRTTRSSPRWTACARSSSIALGVRKAASLRVRQPLRELRVAIATRTPSAPFADLIASELNVKVVDLVDGRGGAAERSASRRGSP